jgi:hypothetical protein
VCVDNVDTVHTRREPFLCGASLEAGDAELYFLILLLAWMQASSRPRNISAWQLTSQLTKNHCRSERTCESLSTKSCFSAKTRCGFGMERVCGALAIIRCNLDSADGSLNMLS